MLKLYYANIDLIQEESVFCELLEKVNIQRREKVLRCKHEKDKLRSLLAGYLLRTALEREGFVYDELEFLIDTNGKPALKSVPEVFFSLSHAGEYAVCLISDRNVGMDVETKTKPLFKEGKKDKIVAIAEKILSNQEWEQFTNAANEEATELFLQLWTRKECYSKADGKGLKIELNAIETNTDRFFSKWLDENSCLSIYVEDGNFLDLQIEEVTHL